MSCSKLVFILRVGLCILGVAPLFSCSLVSEVSRPSPASPTSLANQPVTPLTSTPEQVIFATPTPTSSPTPRPSPLPTLFPTPQFRIPGRFVFVADGEIFLATASCYRKWVACSITKVQLTNTSRPEQEFAAEIFSDQITASPDGKSIAFAYRESPEHKGAFEGGWDIYVLDIEACQGLEKGCDAQMFTRLTGEPFDETSPAWAPDGSLIAFTSNQGPYEPFINPYELFLMQSDGSSQVRIIGTEDLPDISSSIYDLGWSPDSQKIVFTAMTGLYRHPDTFVYTANRDGSDVRQLTFLPHEENMNKSDYRPQWSPDGTQIIFESNREPPGLYVMNSDGSELRYVADGLFPRWSPDGTMIASVSPSGIRLLERDNGYTVDLSLGHVRSYEWIK